MARRCVHISCLTDDGVLHVRTFGGNTTDVRNIVNEYKQMTKEQFLLKHPYFVDKCKDAFGIRMHGHYV